MVSSRRRSWYFQTTVSRTGADYLSSHQEVPSVWITPAKRACIRRTISLHRPFTSSGELPSALARTRFQALQPFAPRGAGLVSMSERLHPLGLRARKPRSGPPPVLCFFSPARIGPMPGRLAAPERRWCYRPLCFDAVLSLISESCMTGPLLWVISTPAPAANRHAEAETAPHDGAPLGTGDSRGSAGTTVPGRGTAATPSRHHALRSPLS